jgi:anti-anti-sigma factor
MDIVATNQSDFAMAEDNSGRGLRCVLSGRLDTERCGRISEAILARLQASGQPVTFDLADVPFVASAFLRLCILAARVVGSGNVRLANTAPPIKKVFKIAGLDGPIRID